jgi:hypothetical protein
VVLYIPADLLIKVWEFHHMTVRLNSSEPWPLPLATRHHFGSTWQFLSKTTQWQIFNTWARFIDCCYILTAAALCSLTFLDPIRPSVLLIDRRRSFVVYMHASGGSTMLLNSPCTPCWFR